jgi:hypothetical protein
MKQSLLFISIIVVLLLLTLTNAQDTQTFVNFMINRYSNETISNDLNCILSTTCNECTSNPSCAWISGSDIAVVTIRESDGTLVPASNGASFCWRGRFYGGMEKSIEMKNDKNSVPDVVYATIGYNDFNYGQCTIRGGIALAAAIIIPVGALVALSIGILICMCCCCRRRKRISRSKSCC